jgi:tetratricopeptide (TPR) repeat protein
VRSTLLAAAAAAVALGCASTPRLSPSEQLALRQRDAAETARRHDDPRTAATLYGHASETAAAGDRPALAADAAYRQGLALLASGAATQALEPLERSARQARALGDRGLAARALLALARARWTSGQGDVDAALGEARGLAAQAGDGAAEALAELGLGARAATPAQARAHYDAAASRGGSVPEVAGPLWLNRGRLAEREGDPASARRAYGQAIGPLSFVDDRPGLLAALAAAARLAELDPASGAEAAGLHRRAAAVASGLGQAEVARAEEAAARRMEDPVR